MHKRSPLRIQQSVVFALILRETRARLYSRRMGALWMFLEPVIHVVALLSFVIILRGRSVPGLEAPVYFLSGIAPFLIFRNVCLRMMEAVSANQGLFAYRQIKPLDTMLARLVVEVALGLSVYFIILAFLALFFRYNITIHRPMEWLGIFSIGVFFSFSVGVVFCIVAEEIPEIKGVIRMLFFPLYFISGVVVPPWMINERILAWIDWNPFLHIVEGLRSTVFLYNPSTQGLVISYPFKVTFFSLFFALALYRLRRLRLVSQ